MTNKKGNILIVILTTLSLASLSMVGVFFWQKLQPPKAPKQPYNNTADLKENNNKQEAPTLPTPIAPQNKISEILNWKEYSNTEYRYSIKYPANWTVSSLPGTNVSTFHEPLFSSPCSFDNYETCIQIYLLAAKYNQTAKIYDGDIVYSSGRIQNKTKTKVGGTVADQFEFLENERLQYFVTVLKNDIKFTFMFAENKKGKVYKSASDWENKTVFDQILSTFTFLDNPLNTFCGGFSGKLCPDGYMCQYDGNYPDASGKCVKQNTYKCPTGGWIGCMPSPDMTEENKRFCAQEAIEWYKENCPNFKGVAY